MNLGILFCIISLLLIVGGAIYLGYSEKKILKLENFELKETIKKNLLSFLIILFCFVIGLVFAVLAFFYDSSNLSYFNSNDLVFSPLNMFYSYFGAIFFGIFAFVLIHLMIWLLYAKNIPNKTRKLLRIILVISIVGVIGFLLMLMEGLSSYLSYPLCNQILISSKGIKMIYNNGSYDSSGFHLSISLYSLCIVGGACLVLYICDYKIFRKYGKHGLLTGCFLVAFPCGIIGARIWYVIGEWYKYADDPIRALYIWEGGLAIMGGAIFGIIAGVTFMLLIRIKNPIYKKIDYFDLVDIIVPTILVAQAIGRWGNFFNCEVHGNPSSIVYWNWLPTFIKNNMHYSSTASSLGSDEIYVPLYLIEGIVNLFGYFFIEYGIRNLFGLNHKFKKNLHSEGTLVGWYISWYGATRAILEPLRYGSYNMGEDGNWSIVSAYVMIGLGVFIIIIFAMLKILNEKKIFKYTWQKAVEKDLIAQSEEITTESNVESDNDNIEK